MRASSGLGEAAPKREGRGKPPFERLEEGMRGGASETQCVQINAMRYRPPKVRMVKHFLTASFRSLPFVNPPEAAVEGCSGRLPLAAFYGIFKVSRFLHAIFHASPHLLHILLVKRQTRFIF